MSKRSHIYRVGEKSYEQGNYLGQGGLASVYTAKALDAEAEEEKDLVMKIYHGGFARLSLPRMLPEAFEARQRAESKGVQANTLVASLAYDLDMGVLIMEHVKGPDLKRMESPRNETELNRLILALKGAVHACMKLNEAGFSHCDIKPENIVFSEAARGQSTLLDLDSLWDRELGKGGLLMGADHPIPITPYSVAPELIQKGLRGIHPKTDVYGLGITAARLVTNIFTFFSRKFPFDVPFNILLGKKRRGESVIDTKPVTIDPDNLGQIAYGIKQMVLGTVKDRPNERLAYSEVLQALEDRPPVRWH